MGLRARGHRLLVDDTTVVEFRDDGVWITPYARNVHLLPDAAGAVGVDFDALPLLAGRLRQGRVPGRGTTEEPHRIDRIVVLTQPEGRHRGDPRSRCGAPTGSRCFDNTSAASVSHQLILGQPAFFALLARLADAAPVQVLRRPPDDWTLEAVLDAIESGSADAANGST